MHTLERKEPIQTAMASDFGEAGGAMVDFQPPMTHTLVKENQKEKGTFEKMFLDGRPPVNVGVTSGGDLFGGTQVTFSDVLGDKQFNVFAASISQYRTFSGNYTNLSRRFQYALQGFSQEQFFYGTGSYFYDPAYNPIFLDRDNALATRTMRGGSAFGIYPLDRYRRLELFGSVIYYNERYNDPTLEEYSNDYQEAALRHAVVPRGHVGAARCGVRPGDHRVPRVRTAVGQHDAAVVRSGAEDRRLALVPDRRPRRAQVHPPGRLGAAGAAGQVVQELGRRPGLHLLRRQLGTARVRVPRSSRATTCSS